MDQCREVVRFQFGKDSFLGLLAQVLCRCLRYTGAPLFRESEHAFIEWVVREYILHGVGLVCRWQVDHVPCLHYLDCCLLQVP